MQVRNNQLQCAFFKVKNKLQRSVAYMVFVEMYAKGR